MALDIEKFDPNVSELQELVANAGLLSLPDPSDEAQVTAIKGKRIQLRDARVRVEKRGKELRQEAIDFQKAVIVREKELIAIIEPEEQRLKGLEEEAKHFALVEKRKAQLPERREKLKSIGITDITDEALLELDDEQFDAFYNKCVADKNTRDAAELKAREDAVKAAEEKQKHDGEIAAAAEAARKKAEEDGARQIEEAKKREAEAEERARRAKETAEREARERQEREAREKAEADRIEQERLKKEENVRITLEMHGYTEETKNDFIIQRSGDTVNLFKKIASFDA